jgi:uracil-DNA glycosylase
MQVAPQERGKILAESIIGWWRDAGVDYLCEDAPFNWLADRDQASAPVEATKQALQPTSSAQTQNIVHRSDWPEAFAALQLAIATDAMLPGNGYGPVRAAPLGAAEPELMVFTDFPEAEDLDAGQLGQGRMGRLLRAMLSACGYTMDQVYLAALAYSRPASGALPKADSTVLADFARHQIKVTQPRQLLFFGSAVSEILLNKELMESRSLLPDFNHEGRNVTTVTTFHPRTLLARPVLKAQAWKDLQRIVKKDRM